MLRETVLALTIMLGTIIAANRSAYAETTNGPKGCPLEFAVRGVDDFVRNQLSKYADQSTPLLDGMKAISNKATKPGISIKDQLSPKDIDRFNQFRHLNIQLDAEKLAFSDLQRDVHVIYETYKAAELADLYETQIDDLGDADPRRFYFTVLQGLRIAQPRTTRTPLINIGIDCDPEAGLYFQEEFYQQQLATAGADQKLVNLIFDIERLRTLYQLNWKLFDKGIDDLRATKWNGDVPSTPDSVAPMIATSSAATQNIYNAIIPYVARQLPSTIALYTRFMASQVQQATRDYPLQKQKK